MKSPTRNASRPNAVRFKWKLSVSRARSGSSSASTGRNLSPATIATGGAAVPMRSFMIRRESRSGRSSNNCAAPMSTINTPGGASARALIGGSLWPLSVMGVSPSVSPKSSSVSGETSVCPGDLRKLSTPCASRMRASCVPRGRVRGSIPITRCDLSPIRTTPSSTGDTFQPANRS